MKTKFDPSLFFALSVLLGYLATLLPWMNLTVQPVIDKNQPSYYSTEPHEENLSVGESSQSVARFWESSPMYFTDNVLQNSCAIGVIEWKTEHARRVYRGLNIAGWFLFIAELCLWGAFINKHGKIKTGFSFAGLFLFVVFLCALWILIMMIIGPVFGCPQLKGVIVHKVAPVFSTLAVALGSVGLGVIGLRSSSVSNGDATR